MTDRVRSSWGWGWEDAHLDDAARRGLRDQLNQQLPGGSFDLLAPVPPHRVLVPDSRLEAPLVLAEFVTDDLTARMSHARGNAYRDIVRAFHGELAHYPDLVARPRDESEVAAVLDWCGLVGAACIPFGGGTSVVGGVNPPGDAPAVSLDLAAFDRVMDVDLVSHAARIQGGTFGPSIEDQLRPHRLTLRHFPQSWEFSTLGGWIATRAGGHYATLNTRIDDMVESVRAVTPSGVWESRRLPASGAGPSPDGLLLGSEGTLGVITEAWVRVQPRPAFRAQASVTFHSFTDGAKAVRALARSDLYPANCRLLDATEAALTGAGDGTVAVLVLGFESADHPLGPWVTRALELCADHGGSCPEGPRLREGDTTGTAEGASGAWRSTFLAAPYLRDAVVSLGGIAETFETAITWDRFDEYVDAVGGAARDAATATCGSAVVTTRITHAYPDGAAPYFTVIAPGTRGSEVGQWDEIKTAASEVISARGGTITHHHAVGRDHRPWYDRERPDLFALAFQSAKLAVDPNGVLNPGVLIDPSRQ